MTGTLASVAASIARPTLARLTSGGGSLIGKRAVEVLVLNIDHDQCALRHPSFLPLGPAQPYSVGSHAELTNLAAIRSSKASNPGMPERQEGRGA